MFAFNLSHDEMLKCFVGILPHSIFNRKTSFEFQNLTLSFFDVQIWEEQIIARHLKERNTYLVKSWKKILSFS